MISNTSPYSNNAALFSNPSIEDKNVTSPFQTAEVNPYSYRPEGFTNMNYHQPQLTTNHYQSIYPNHLKGSDFFNKK